MATVIYALSDEAYPETIRPELIAKRFATLRGRKRTPEHCAALSAAKKGKKIKPCSDERREKVRAALAGKPKPWQAALNRQRARKQQQPHVVYLG